MDRELFRRAKELLREALALPPADRPTFLERVSAESPELGREVADLLAHAGAAGDAFLTPGPSQSSPPAPRLAIPGFRVLELLATGGSGTVYRARQIHPQRDVALKVLRLDSLAPGQVARFQREAEILASLDHPGIARVIAAGMLEDDSVRLPWIALEFVRGTTLDEHAAARGPDWRATLALFCQVCDAVDHAHQRGIVHRDLKPSNVMVDEAGRPRVLDFGIARALGGPEPVTAAHTRTGMLVGTLTHMAPEQARGERELAPSADVYALGVMLFELLTGRAPLELDTRGLLEVAQVICAHEPERLRRLRPDLPRDLDTILAKTLEKEALRRYASAGELAADLRRLLAQRPILARRQTAFYQARKFVRRNRALSAATAAVVLALAVGLGFALAGLRATREQSARTSHALDVFASKMLDFAPQLGFGEEKRADWEELLALVERQLEVDPSRALRGARANLLYELARLDQARGDPRAMQARLESARAAREELVAADPADLASWTHISQIFAKLGEVARASGDMAGRDAWFARALELDERLVREHPGNLELIEDLGWSLERLSMAASERGDHAQAERLSLRRLADAEELVRGAPENWKFVFNLSHVHYFLVGMNERDGRLEQAAAHSRENVRLAWILRGLQPGRRDSLEWLADSCLRARALGIALGDIEGACAQAADALALAEELVLGDPLRESHWELLSRASREYAELELSSGRTEPAQRTANRLRRIVERACRSGASQPLSNLLALAAELEAQALARGR